MNKPKFHIGQKVVCIDAECSTLDLLRCYTVTSLTLNDLEDAVDYSLDGEEYGWMEERFEDFDTWAGHQKPVKDTLTKREEVLVKALKRIVSDYSRGGFGHFEAKLVAEMALSGLGL